jgi:hypothetical protein
MGAQRRVHGAECVRRDLAGGPGARFDRLAGVVLEQWLRDANEWGVFVVLLAFLLGASETGYRIARRVHAPGEAPSSEVAAIQGAVLGLLALLLGFTFSLAMSRFETRKELIRDEANVIGTAYLRTQLLPEPQRSRSAELMRRYVDTRIDLQRYGYEQERLRAISATSAELQEAMWSQSVAVARADADSEMMSLVISSLNELIDTHGMQVAAIRNRVPVSIFLLLSFVAVASMGLTGYAAGPSHRQSATLTVLVSVLVASVILLIFDLHRPMRGFIHADLASLLELRESMLRR